MRIPGFFVKRFLDILVSEKFIEISFKYGKSNQYLGSVFGQRTLRDLVGSIVIHIDKEVIYKPTGWPSNYLSNVHIKLNQEIYSNRFIDQILEKTLVPGTTISLIVQNTFKQEHIYIFSETEDLLIVLILSSWYFETDIIFCSGFSSAGKLVP